MYIRMIKTVEYEYAQGKKDPSKKIKSKWTRGREYRMYTVYST
jgi:hypothetical protein